MTHASKSLDAFERLQEIRDNIAREAEKAELIASELERARAEHETRLALANALAFLATVNTRNMSEGQRLQRRGVMDQIQRVIAA